MMWEATHLCATVQGHDGKHDNDLNKQGGSHSAHLHSTQMPDLLPFASPTSPTLPQTHPLPSPSPPPPPSPSPCIEVVFNADLIVAKPHVHQARCTWRGEWGERGGKREWEGEREDGVSE